MAENQGGSRTDKRSKKWPHLFVRITAFLNFFAGLPMLFGGLYLILLGGNWYYAIAGLGLSTTGYFLWNGKMRGVYIFLAVLAFTLIWALLEVGFSFWPLVPRLVAPIFLGALVLFAVKHLWGTGRPADTRPYTIGGWVLTAGFVAYLVAMFFPHDIITNNKQLAMTPYAGDTNPDWVAWGRTGGGSRFTPFDQINADNIDKLEVAWTARTGFIADQKDSQQDQTTPLYVDGTLYHCGPVGQISAIDGTTGAIKWQFDPKAKSKDWKRCRSVAYYDPGEGDACGPRIIETTVDARLISIKASDGQLCETFGEGGMVNIWSGMGDMNSELLTNSSGPVVVKGKIIFGGRVVDNIGRGEPSGVIRAYDAKTGSPAWVWDLGNPDLTGPPAPDQTYTAGTPNAWSLLSFDEKLGLVYIPLGGAPPDIYGGGRRPFDDEYSGSVVALSVDTGKEAWHFQTTHHDLWDYDIPSQPVLADIPDGKGGLLPGVIVTTKRAQTFVLNRETGQPIKRVEERPAPSGNGKVQGEYYAKTQPYSPDMHAVGAEPLTPEMMWGATPIDQMMCRILLEKYTYDGDFTAPSENWGITWPGPMGGYNYGSSTIDEEHHVMTVVEMRFSLINRLVPRDKVTPDLHYTDEDGYYFPMKGTPYALERKAFSSPLGIPCNQPPWGTISAIDLNTGQQLWQYPAGSAKDLALGSFKPHLGFFVGLPPLGGAMTTKGGIAWFAGTQDYYLRAFDTQSGKPLWKARLPVGSQGIPMSYIGQDGRQYVVVSAGGARGNMSEFGDYVIAYALPKQ